MCILGGVSAPSFHIWFILSYSKQCLQQVSLGKQEASSIIWTVQSSPVHLTSAHAFKDFSLHAPLTLLPLLAQGPFLHFALHSAYYLLLCSSFSLLCQILQHSVLPSKSGNCPSELISGMEDFGPYSCLPSLKTLCLWILFPFCPTVDMLNGLILIGFHYAWASFIVTRHENNGAWS